MSLVSVAIKRPVTIAMFTLAALIFGSVSLARLPVNLLPDIAYPTLTVRTLYPGAAPAEVETVITRPIEESLGVIKNLRQVRSASLTGQADVTLEFEWGTNMDFAVLDVREKLDALELPEDVKRPLVLRFDPSSEPIVKLGFAYQSDNKALDDSILKRLRRIAENQLQKKLESVTGVAAVKISGGLEDEIQVDLQQKKLEQFNLTVDDVIGRVRDENVNLSGGRVEEGTLKYLVRTMNQFRDLDDIRNTIIRRHDEQNIYLKDIATVSAGYHEREAIIRINGNEAVELALYREGDANTVTVARQIGKSLEKLKKHLPEHYQLTTLYDQSVFIRHAIDNVIQAAMFGGLLAILILYIFLGNAWATAIVSIAIPVSVVTTFNMMYLGGMSLNIMSMGGIALAIGLLVDNAIVVLENIFRHRKMGKSIPQAAQDGAGEVSAAVTASTLTTVAVFFPMVFVEGVAGELFSDQALVVTFALLISLLISLTLIPAMSARQVQHRRPEDVPQEQTQPQHVPETRSRIRVVGQRVARFFSASLQVVFEKTPIFLLKIIRRVTRFTGDVLHKIISPLANIINRTYEHFHEKYPGSMNWALANRSTSLLIAALLFALSLMMLPFIGVELIPSLNQSEFSVKYTLPPGTPLETTDRQVNKTRGWIKDNEAVKLSYSVSGTGNRIDANPESAGENTGELNIILTPGQPASEEKQLKALLRQHLDKQAGLEYQFVEPTLFSFKTPLEIEIYSYDLDKLGKISDSLVMNLQQDKQFSEIQTSISAGHPELQVVFDQERLSLLGLQASDVANRVVKKLKGYVATRFRLPEREIDVLVRNDEDSRQTVQEIKRLIINPENDKPITLSAVADIKSVTGHAEILRVNQQRVATVTADITYGDLGGAADKVRAMISALSIPEGVMVHVTGQNEEMEVSFKSMKLALLLAVFMVYLVMASQFESLVHPFVILFTIPLAMTGAIFALFITGSVINVVVFIGLIILAGIVVNNGIVLIDLVNRLRGKGLSRDEAIIQAGQERLRPILMTTLTTVLGLVPLAIGIGEGAEIRTPMAITVIGGLLMSTFLTLYIIPLVYTLFDSIIPFNAERYRES